MSPTWAPTLPLDLCSNGPSQRPSWSHEFNLCLPVLSSHPTPLLWHFFSLYATDHYLTSFTYLSVYLHEGRHFHSFLSRVYPLHLWSACLMGKNINICQINEWILFFWYLVYPIFSLFWQRSQTERLNLPWDAFRFVIKENISYWNGRTVAFPHFSQGIWKK